MNLVTQTWSVLAQSGGQGGMPAVVGILYLVVGILTIAGGWKAFVKAGKPGWAILVPIYNVIVMLEIAGKPLWWILLLLVPVVNFIITIVVMISIAEKFGKGAGFGVGMAFLPFVFWPMLGFGSAEYQG